MTNKRIRNNKKALHLYAFGDRLNKISDKLSGNLTSKSQNLLNTLGPIAEGISDTLAGGNSTGVGSAMQTIGSLASNIPGVGGIIGTGVNVLGSLVNAAFGSNINEKAVKDIEQANASQRNITVDQSSYDNLLAQQASQTPLGIISQDEVGTDGWFSNKAKNLTKTLNEQRNAANLAAQNAFAVGADNIEDRQLNDLLSNYMAEGGKIHINPSKKGTFTAAAKRRGKGVQEFARQVLANKEDYSPAMVKKANFARNASKWKHADGGYLSDDEYSYIGGSPREARQKYYDRDTEFADSVKSVAKRYNIPANVLATRLAQEGVIDSYINMYNTTKEYPRTSLSGFTDFGLDDFYTHYKNGDVKLLEDYPVYESPTINEHGSPVSSVDFDEWYQPISAVAAELVSRRDYMKKKFPKVSDNNLWAYAQAGYHRGNAGAANLIRKGKLNPIDSYPVYIKLSGSEPFGYDKPVIKPKPIKRQDLSKIDESSVSPILEIPEAKINIPVLYNEGGKIDTRRTDFTNGVKTINEGGLHETNPLNGVPMGIAPDGEPNLVEEGEVIYNDYVYSNRLFPDKKVLQEVGLPTKYNNYSFAYIAEKLSKESEERPNDPISMSGLKDSMNKLQQAQEVIKEMKKIKNNKNYKELGGHLFDGYNDSYIETVDGIKYEVPFYGADASQWKQIPDIERLGSSISLDFNTSPNLTKAVPNLIGNPYNRYINPANRGADEYESTDGVPSFQVGSRYAPIIGSAVNVMTDRLGITNRPDYSNPNLIGKAASNLREVSYRPVSNYLSYKPLDRNYYTNQLRSQAAANRRAIMNQSNGNRATAMAALLAADNNAQMQLGNLARQAEEYNRSQKERVEAFNRGTEQLNSEGAMRAALANQNLDKVRLQAAVQEASFRDQIDRATSAAKSSNLSNLLTSLGELGKENFAINMVNSNPYSDYTLNKRGQVHYKRKKRG